MSLRAEMRRQARMDAKQLRDTDRLIEVAKKAGVEFDELQSWKSREYQKMRNEIQNVVAAKFTKEYAALLDEYNRRLKEQEKEYNRILDERTKILAEDIMKDLIKDFNEQSYKAENWICLVNILITCLAIHKAWGYKAGIKKFLDRWNDAKAELNSLGVKAAMERVNSFGLDFDFDSFEVEDFIRECAELDVNGVMEYVDTKAGGKGGKTKADIQSEGAGSHPDA